MSWRLGRRESAVRLALAAALSYCASVSAFIYANDGRVTPGVFYPWLAVSFYGVALITPATSVVAVIAVPAILCYATVAVPRGGLIVIGILLAFMAMGVGRAWQGW